MKRFYQIVSSSFIVIGSVIGAGFISGREIVSFFSGAMLIPSVYMVGLIFFLFTMILFRIGEQFGEETRANRAVFGKFYPLLEGVILFSCMISVCSMLAGLDALTESFLHKIPVLSVVCLLVSTFCLRRGIRGIAAVNLIMVPFMIVIVVFFLLKKGEFSVLPAQVSGTKDFKIVLYAAMNLFLSSQVMIGLGGKIDRKCQIISSIIMSVILSLMIVLIMSAVAFEGANAQNAEMPLYYLFQGSGAAALIFGIVVFFGIFTTLLTSYYPLYRVCLPQKKEFRGSDRLSRGVCFVAFRAEGDRRLRLSRTGIAGAHLSRFLRRVRSARREEKRKRLPAARSGKHLFRERIISLSGVKIRVTA